MRAVEAAQNDSASLWVSSSSWKQKFVGLNVFMAVFHRFATRWLSRIKEDYSRSQVASYLTHTGGLCPEEDSVLRLGTTFHYAQDHAEQSRLKSLLMMRNESPERKAKSEGECFETHTGPESSKNNGM